MTFVEYDMTELLNGKGKNLLYFGCRHKNKDFLYKDELGKPHVRFNHVHVCKHS